MYHLKNTSLGTFGNHFPISSISVSVQTPVISRNYGFAWTEVSKLHFSNRTELTHLQAGKVQCHRITKPSPGKRTKGLLNNKWSSLSVLNTQSLICNLEVLIPPVRIHGVYPQLDSWNIPLAGQAGVRLRSLKWNISIYIYMYHIVCMYIHNI